MDIEELRKKRLDDLKVGDKVYVREGLKIGNYYDGSIYSSEMTCGIVTVRSIERYPFSIFSSGEPTGYRYFTVEEVSGEFRYTGEMVDWAKTEKLNISLYEKIDNIRDLKEYDKVYIRGDLLYGRIYGGDKYVPGMRKGVNTVRCVSDHCLEKGIRIYEDEIYKYTPEMIDWEKTAALNKKAPKKDVSNITPTYDGTTICWDGIKVVRDDKHNEDLEKAVMMLLLKKEGYYFGDIKNVIKKTKIKWIPMERERFYYINDAGKVSSDAYVKDFAIHELFIKFGNCFKTKEEAMSKLEQVKKLLSE